MRRVETHELDEIVGNERPRFRGWRRRQRLGPDRIDGPDGCDAELVGTRARLDVVARDARVAELHRGGAAGCIAREAHGDAAGVGGELRLRALGDRRDAERGVDQTQLALVLGDDAPRRALAVLAEQAEPAHGRRRGSVGGCKRDARRAPRRCGSGRPTRAAREGKDDGERCARRPHSRAARQTASASSAADTTTVSARATPSVPSVLSYHSLAV